MARYSRKDYVEVAGLLKTHPNRMKLFPEYVSKFEMDNPRFDKARFKTAVFGVKR